MARGRRAAARMNPRLRRIAGRVARRIGLRPPLPGRRPTNGRLAFVGPMPPAATGKSRSPIIGAVLDRALGRIGFLERHRTDVLVAGEGPPPALDPQLRPRDLPAREQRRVPSASPSASPSPSPGLVVLHDLALDGLVRKLEMAGHLRVRRDSSREAAALRGPLHSDPDISQNEPLRVVWCAAVARAARGIVVHSEFCKRYLETVGVRTPIFTVPHPVVEDEASMRRSPSRARAELRATLRAGRGSHRGGRARRHQ